MREVIMEVSAALSIKKPTIIPVPKITWPAVQRTPVNMATATDARTPSGTAKARMKRPSGPGPTECCSLSPNRNSSPQLGQCSGARASNERFGTS